MLDAVNPVNAETCNVLRVWVIHSDSWPARLDQKGSEADKIDRFVVICCRWWQMQGASRESFEGPRGAAQFHENCRSTQKLSETWNDLWRSWDCWGVDSGKFAPRSPRSHPPWEVLCKTRLKHNCCCRPAMQIGHIKRSGSFRLHAATTKLDSKLLLDINVFTSFTSFYWRMPKWRGEGFLFRSQLDPGAPSVVNNSSREGRAREHKALCCTELEFGGLLIKRCFSWFIFLKSENAEHIF